jgi:hypothetical protein
MIHDSDFYLKQPKGTFSSSKFNHQAVQAKHDPPGATSHASKLKFKAIICRSTLDDHFHRLPINACGRSASRSS